MIIYIYAYIYVKAAWADAGSPPPADRCRCEESRTPPCRQIDSESGPGQAPSLKIQQRGVQWKQGALNLCDAIY